ncbi:MAG: hypothetical protein O9262_07550, partial [Cyclobacteriaceae bacterium]|nr:hypothetical protein [Cyclobacteriaceae bacterium]
MIKNRIIFFLLLLFTSCSENEEFKYVAVVTKSLEYNNANNATFHGIVENESSSEITESGFILSVRSQDNTGVRLISSDPSQSVLTQSTNYLLPGKEYYLRAYVVTDGISIYGNELSFKTTGEVNKGQWREIVQENESGWCVFVRSVFSLGDNSYFILADKGMYTFNHVSQTFKLTLQNNIIRSASYGLVYKNEVYVFSTDRFYKFNPANNTLTGLSARPVSGYRAFHASFVINNEVYIGLGQSPTGYTKDFWKYNLDTDIWERIADFPGHFRSSPFSFALGNRGYTGGGYNLIEPQWPYPKFEDLWQFNPELDQWTQRESLPIDNEELFDLRGTENAGKGYCFYKKTMWEYEPTYNYWEPMAELSSNEQFCYPMIFSYNNKVYL